MDISVNNADTSSAQSKIAADRENKQEMVANDQSNPEQSQLLQVPPRIHKSNEKPARARKMSEAAISKEGGRSSFHETLAEENLKYASQAQNRDGNDHQDKKDGEQETTISAKDQETLDMLKKRRDTMASKSVQSSPNE